MPPRDTMMQVFSGSANPGLAQTVAKALNIQLSPLAITKLPDSEIHVQINVLVRDQDVFIIQPCPAPVNDHLVELLLTLDAFRRASARRINVILPYFPYARQDRMAKGRESISAKMVARMLEMAGASRVLYVDIHALQIQGFFDIPVDPLTALPVLTDYFGTRSQQFHPHQTIIVSPDVGRARLASLYAEKLKMPLAIMNKRRLDFDTTESMGIVGDVRGKTAILIDDLIAGGSILDQIPALVEAGVKPPVYLAISHPVLLPSAIDRLNRDDVGALITTDTIPIPPESMHPKIKVQSIAPILADAIRRIHHGQTVSPLIELQ